MANRPATIMIVDDHPMVRDGLRARITNEEDLTVCGEADNVSEALQLVGELRPDLLIVDISLKTGYGIDLIKQVHRDRPHVKILVNSMYDESIYAERSLQAGALGYLNKQSAREAVIDAIRTVLAGNMYLSPAMTDHILKSRVGSGALEPGKSPIENLSDRELEVLTLIGQAQTTGAIASRLHLSVHTIDTYREKLKLKLNLANSAELVRYAVQWVLEHG